MSALKKLFKQPKLEPAAARPPAEGVAGHLLHVSLFEDIWAIPEALDQLARIIEPRTFSLHSKIIQEGEVSNELFIMISGHASVYKKTMDGDSYKVAVLKGENRMFFGEAALLDTDPRTATIVADTDVDCLVLRAEAFELFCAQYPHWALPVLRRVARVTMGRLRKANNDFMLLYHALLTEVRGY